MHRVPARSKIIALVIFAFAVVMLPREWFAAHGAAAIALVAVAVIARIPFRTIVARLAIDLPFVVFALLMPLIGTGERVEVGALSLSVPGLWAAWALLAKATLTLVAAVIVSATTEPRHIVLGLEQLRLPRELTSIMGFMLRYLDIIVEEYARMRTARASRGFVAGGPRSWRVLGQSMGASFVRAHGRGERVHLARLSRGYGVDGAGST